MCLRLSGGIKRMNDRMCEMQDLINFLRERNAKQADAIIKLTGENKKMESLLNRFQGPNIPGETEYNDKRGKWRQEEVAGQEPKKAGKRGPPAGHAGVSHGNVPAQNVYHRLAGCPCCGGDRFKARRPVSKMVVDFAGSTMRMVPVMHTQERGTCLGCGHLTTAYSPAIPGTMFGEKALGFITEYAGRKNTDGDIAGYFANLYGFDVSPNAIWNARQAATALLEKTYRHIMEELKTARFIGMDESPFRIAGILGQVWLARSETATFMIMTTSRRKENLTDHFSDLFLIPVVVDGHKSYERCFMTIQRCWAHVLRQAEKLAMSMGKHSQEHKLHKDLLKVFHDAKQIAASAGGTVVADDTCMDLKNRVLEIATLYGNHRFAGHLRNAAPYLFTFLKYPGMPPTNNPTEGDIRDGVVIERKIRQKMVNAKGMHVFSVIHSFTQTCRKLRLVPWKEIANMVHDPDWNIFDEARRQNTIPHVPDRMPPPPPQLPAPPALPQLPVHLPDSDPASSGNTKPALPVCRITACMILAMLGVTWHEMPNPHAGKTDRFHPHAKSVGHHVSDCPPPGIPPPELLTG